MGEVCCAERRCKPILCPQPNTFILVPEAWGLTAYFTLLAFMLTAVATNYHVVDKENNMIMRRYGANSICVFMDDPPFNLFAATL